MLIFDIIVLLFLLLLSLAICKERKKYTLPIVIFNFFWLVCITLSCLNLFNLKPVNIDIYNIVVLGAVFFNFGYIITQKIKVINLQSDYVVNERYINFFYIISLAFLFFLSFYVTGLLINGVSFVNIRYNYIDSIFNTTFSAAFYKFVCFPLCISFVFLFVSDSYIQKKIRRKYLLMAISLTSLDLFVSNDRMILMFWIIGLLILYSHLSFNDLLANRKRIRRLFIVASVIFLLIIVMRGGHIFKSVYTYSMGGFRFFSQRIDSFHIDEKTYFVSSYQGILRPFVNVFELFGARFDLFDKASDFLLSNQNDARAISTDNLGAFNYFITPFAYFFKDFGWVGVAVHSFIWGGIVSAFYSSYKTNENLFTVGLYFFGVMSIFLGIMDYIFVEVGPCWGVIFYLFIFIRNPKKQIGEKQ